MPWPLSAPWKSFTLALLLTTGGSPSSKVSEHQHLDHLAEKLEQSEKNDSIVSREKKWELPVPQLIPSSPKPYSSFPSLKQNWEEYRLQCLKYLRETPPLVPEGKFCNRTFDNYVCWPDGIPGTYVNMSCPWYLPSGSSGQVYRYCTLEGTWLMEENSTNPWRNISACMVPDEDSTGRRLLFLSVIYTTGYALSFSALVIATGILLWFRHLHCTRNYIHLNLFTSFILRAVSIFIKDSMLTWMYKTAPRQQQWESVISYQGSLSCRLIFVMMQYCVTANYYWLLVEGMYLYTLLALSVFSEQRIFRLYLCVGWGVPMLFVILWGIVKYLYEDEGCWNKNLNMNYWLIIRLPIMVAIGVNFLIFIRVICIIISKLQANLLRKNDIKCRLAKSTLTLIPLLGTHEIIFAFVTDEHAKGMLRFVKLFFELSSSSFQGLLVAILYCFNNTEVRTEFQKSWERWRLEHFYVQRDNSMKPLKYPANSISSGGTVGTTVYAATCQVTTFN
ncbi:glucagon-like peptide 1 receptor [Ahaetulla prasina]|uniref:glucagon-like peptide 1 receptor n=1 Tax=Ahaetulla prasina TaxID=499056 RepID=UPI00264A3102|nr:glucagon-like peptide 1 receptor [Ahaetulla prasina]